MLILGLLCLSYLLILSQIFPPDFFGFDFTPSRLSTRCSLLSFVSRQAICYRYSPSSLPARLFLYPLSSVRVCSVWSCMCPQPGDIHRNHAEYHSYLFQTGQIKTANRVGCRSVFSFCAFRQVIRRRIATSVPLHSRVFCGEAFLAACEPCSPDLFLPTPSFGYAK